MAAMRILDLHSNEVTDVRPLIRMRELEILKLGRNPITNFSPLINLDKLRILEVDREKLTKSSLVEIKASNPKINIRGVN